MLVNFTIYDFLVLILAYLLGSIPFGLIIAKYSGIGDLRKKGSGNIGATNMTRVAGKKLGAFTLLLDGLKGIIAVLIARYATVGENNSEEIISITAGLAVLGHIFSIWLKFKGGKGVATTLAVYLAVYWPLGLATIIIWLLVFLKTKLSSLSAIFSMLTAPTIALYFADRAGYEIVYLSFFLSVIVTARHHSNILRLINGEEGKIL